MAYVPRSSFIPKESVGAIPMRVRQKQTIHVFAVISILLLIVSSLTAIGSFAYTKVLEKELVAAKISLQEKSTEDSQRTVAELRRYDEKLDLATGLLNNHLAPSLIFKAMEDMTKKTVQFSAFSYTYDPGFQISLKLEGLTKELSSVALQKMQIFNEGIFSNFVFQDIMTVAEDEDSTQGSNVEQLSGVGFSIIGTFKNKVINYTGETNPTPEDLVSSEKPVDKDVASSTATSTEPNTP